MIIIVIIIALVSCSLVFITHTTAAHDRVTMEKGILDSYSLGATTILNSALIPCNIFLLHISTGILNATFVSLGQLFFIWQRIRIAKPPH